MNSAGLVERTLRPLEAGPAGRERRRVARATRRERADLIATSSSEAFPQIPQDAVAEVRSATSDASNGRERRTVARSSGWFISADCPSGRG